MSIGVPAEGKQEGESPAFRAGKGQEFPACESRKGHCGSVGAKGQWGSLHEIEISLLFRELRVFIMSNSGNSGVFIIVSACAESPRLPVGLHKANIFPLIDFCKATY